jgi:hypothetical protein
VDFLEYLYEKEFKNIGFIDRKLTLTEKNTIIIGPKRSGKSYIIFDYLSRVDNKLYIDFEDSRLNKENIFAKLNRFIKLHKIDILIIENIKQCDIDDINKINSIKQIIISSNIDIDCKNRFIKKYLFLLDFEEYVRFDNKNHSTSHLFGLFMKDSVYPEVVLANENKKFDILQSNLLKISTDNITQDIFGFIAKHSGLKFSTLQIYNKLKQTKKISKDKLYKTLDNLQKSGDIYFIPKIGQPKSAKKIFSIDFKLKELFDYKKNINLLLEHILFLELLKQNNNIEYIDKLSFVTDDIGYIIEPFFRIDMTDSFEKLKSHYMQFNIKEIIIISISDIQYEFNIGDIRCKVYPFWIWSMFN